MEYSSRLCYIYLSDSHSILYLNVPGCRILSLHLDGDFYKHKDRENYFMSVLKCGWYQLRWDDDITEMGQHLHRGDSKCYHNQIPSSLNNYIIISHNCGSEIT